MDRPTTAPPLLNAPVAEKEAIPDLSDLQSPPGIDTEALFNTSTDWILLGKAIAVLEDQYEQCLEDIRMLEDLKSKALISPEDFLHNIHQVNFPHLQTIYRCPAIDVDRWQTRSTRRGLNKKDQNTEFLAARLRQLEQRGAAVQPMPMRSDALVIDHDAFSTVHDQFKQKPLSLSLSLFGQFDTNEGDLKHSRSVTPILLEKTLNNNTPSANQQPSTDKKNTSSKPTTKRENFNVPWTKDEKRRLLRLLKEYPEEPVAARRYAKIAAALGTRSATQVFTRVSKLQLKLEAECSSDLSGDSDLGEDAVSDTHTSTSHCTQNDNHTSGNQKQLKREYQKVKQALQAELSGAGTTNVHTGRRCGQCGACPIIGSVYMCARCRFDICEECRDVHVSHGLVSLSDIVDSSCSHNTCGMDEYDYLRRKR